MPSSPISWPLFLPMSPGGSPLPPNPCVLPGHEETAERVEECQSRVLCVTRANPRPFLKPHQVHEMGEHISLTVLLGDISVRGTLASFLWRDQEAWATSPLWAQRKGRPSRQTLLSAAPRAATGAVAPLGSVELFREGVSHHPENQCLRKKERLQSWPPVHSPSLAWKVGGRGSLSVCR